MDVSSPTMTSLRSWMNMVREKRSSLYRCLRRRESIWFLDLRNPPVSIVMRRSPVICNTGFRPISGVVRPLLRQITHMKLRYLVFGLTCFLGGITAGSIYKTMAKTSVPTVVKEAPAKRVSNGLMAVK